LTPRSTATDLRPSRGEVWLIRFDPIEGAEIDKTRPAVVVNLPSVGRLPLRIVVPLTSWQPKFATVPWLVHIKQSPRNGLHKESAADCYQVKSVSLKRFVTQLGDLRAEELEEVSAAIALCVGA
jgi:mRNA interferase MazF